MSRTKSIIVTGAASGIGRETAKLFADRGWRVGILDVDSVGLGTLQSELGAGKCFAQAIDVTDVDGVREAVDKLCQETDGALDVLFNNAGILTFGHFEKVDIKASNRTVDVNLKGLLNCTHCCLKYLKRSTGSHIINMASTSAIYGIPDLSVYSATKHAVCAMTEAWDIELEKYGITVSDIIAPFVNTPLLDVKEQVYCIEKMGINIEPAEVAETVWKAAHGKKLHWIMGSPTYLLKALFWAMPFTKRYVVKSLTIPPK